MALNPYTLIRNEWTKFIEVIIPIQWENRPKIDGMFAECRVPVIYGIAMWDDGKSQMVFLRPEECMHKATVRQERVRSCGDMIYCHTLQERRELEESDSEKTIYDFVNTDNMDAIEVGHFFRGTMIKGHCHCIFDVNDFDARLTVRMPIEPDDTLEDNVTYLKVFIKKQFGFKIK